jgi:hypothetical protein
MVAGAGAGGGDSAFTERGTTEAVDVLHFDMVLVVDARSLPAVIDEICAAGFYTPLLVNYEVVPPNLTLSGYIYGSAPVIRVTLAMEAAMLRAKYAKIMPPSIETERTSGALFQRRKEGGKTPSGPSNYRPGPTAPPRGEDAGPMYMPS